MRLTEIDDVPQRVRIVIAPDTGDEIRVSLPVNEKTFWEAIRYSEDICDNISLFLSSFEAFKLEQQHIYLQRFERTGLKDDKECAAEIASLRIEFVSCGAGKYYDRAEIYCCEIPGAWRDWSCGYSNGQFYALGY